ncbi:hypothetical protein CWD94_12430 [Lysinibacillus xylanilyticus]|uniref:Uncharacterized protein n=1 Tax=Lysinibacillus xylanilyticus TaxID=582475 RepID=A0A2M9Q5V5_9BACI|nr:hypothetical protein CWD94_12430 [Lysinibacillus xylanilyticus]
MVDFRSDWVLCFRIEQSLPGASDEPLGQQVFFARKRRANVAAATGVYSVRKRSATKRQQDVDHEALSQGVMLLAFVPLSF